MTVGRLWLLIVYVHFRPIPILRDGTKSRLQICGLFFRDASIRELK